MSPEWHIQQIINQPTYLHPDLWTDQYYPALRSQFKRFLRLHKYSQATLLAYGYWNNRLIIDLPRAMRFRVYSERYFLKLVPLFRDNIPSFAAVFASISQPHDWVNHYWTQFQKGTMHLTEKLTRNFYLGLKSIYNTLIRFIQHDPAFHSPSPSFYQKIFSDQDNPR